MFKPLTNCHSCFFEGFPQNDPHDSSSQKNWPGGQQNQGHGAVLHVQEEVCQLTLNFRRRVDRDQEWCPWSNQQKNLICLSYTSQFCPNSNLIKDKNQALGLTLLNARSSCLCQPQSKNLGVGGVLQRLLERGLGVWLGLDNYVCSILD